MGILKIWFCYRGLCLQQTYRHRDEDIIQTCYRSHVIEQFEMTVLSSIFKNTQTLSFKMIFAVSDCDLASIIMFKLLSFYVYSIYSSRFPWLENTNAQQDVQICDPDTQNSPIHLSKLPQIPKQLNLRKAAFDTRRG